MSRSFSASRSLAPALLVALVTAGAARAQVSCNLGSDTTAPLIGGTFTTTASLGRSTAGTGFAPALEIFVPPGLSLTQASVLGQTLARQTIGTFGTTLTNPVTGEAVSGPAGFTLVLVRLPFGGLPQGAGPQDVTLTWAVSTSAAAGVTLRPQVTCLFAFGNDALNNPTADAPLRSDVRTNAADQLGVDVTPSLARLRKTASPSPTVTGAGFPIVYSLVLDVADGVTITGGSIQDTLPPQFQILSIATSAGGSVISPSPVPSTPGGALSVSFPSVVGTASASDATVTVRGYVPRLDASAAEILSPTCAGGSTATVTNTASFVGGLVGATAVTVAPATAVLQARAEQVRETITNLTSGGANFRPGETGRVTLTVSASDFFALSSVNLASVLGAGMHYTGNALVDGSPAMPTLSGDFRNVGFALGNVAAGATRTINYEFIVDEAYSAAPGDFVRAGDVLTTRHTLTSTAPSGCALSSTEVDGGADGSITIGAATLTKALQAINGAPAAVGATVRPGDLVTWRITLVQRAGDLSGATITDYLPRPLFNAQQYGAAPAFPSTALRFGPGNTLPSGTSVSLAATAMTADNSLTINVGAFDLDPTVEVRMVFDLDFTVSSDPREDGLGFTNLVRATLQGSGTTTVTTSASSAFGAGDPAVTVHVGAAQVSSTLGGPAKITGIINTNPYSAATFTSATLAALAANALAGPDGADVITYKVIAENRGSTAAQEVQLSNVPPAGVTCEATPLSVTNGVGAALAFTNLTVSGGVGWQLTNALPAYDAASGLNVAVVTLRCTVATTSSWVPNAQVNNTANVLRYASVAGGPNFAPANYVPNADTATLRFANFAVTKTRVGSGDLVTRDVATFGLTVTVPEGTFTNISLVDAFPNRLALGDASGPTLVLPAGVSASGSLSPTVNATGTTVTWALGTVTNTNSTDALETSTAMSVPAVVLSNNNTGTGNVFRVTQLTATLVTATAAALTLRVPALTLTQTVSPNPAAGGATPTVTATIASSSGATNRTAHDVRYSLTAPAGCTTPANLSVTGVVGTGTISGNVVTVDFISIAPGQTATVTFNCSVPALAVIGSSVTLPGTLGWTSQAGTPAQLGPNTAAVEASYTANANTTLNISPLVLTKTRVGTGAVVVGQAIDFDLVMSVPAGTTNAALPLTDVMADGLVFAATSNFTAGAALTCGGVACTLPTPAVTNSGRTVTWNLGTVTNTGGAAQTFAFRLRAYVTNVAAAVRSASLSNTFSAGTPSATTNVTVAEPALSFVATASPTSGNAGDTFTLNVALANSTTTNLNVSAANDVVVGFALPASLEVVAGTYASTTCPAPAATLLTGATPSVSFTTLGATTSCSFTVGVRMRDTVTLGTSVSVGVSAAWSSLPGDVTAPQSTHSAVSTERTGDSANPGGALNTYLQQGSVTLDAAQTAGVTKTFVSSSSTLTADPAVALGEEGTWRLRVRVGEGVTPNVTIVDAPPAALQLTHVTLDTTGFPGTIGVDPTGPLSLAPGAAATFTLGAVSNPGDNDATNDFFTLVVTGRPTLHASVAATAAQNNVATLRSGATTLGTSTLAITYALPRLRITQTVPTTTPAPGAELSGSTTLANQGNGPACAPALVVTAPTGFSFVAPGSDGLDNDQNGTVDDAAEAGFLTGQVLTVPVTGCLAGGSTTVFPWRLRTAASIAAGGVALTSELQPFRSLPAPDGVALSATTDLFDNNNNAQTDEATDGRVSTTLSPAAPVLTVTKTFVDVNGGALVPGDELEWRVVVGNTGTGPSTGLTLSDTLPTMHAAVVAGSATTTQGTATVTGSLFHVDVGDLAAGATVTATVRQRVDPALLAAAQLSNQANLTTSDAYGPRVSDDPATPAVDDATVATVSSGTPTPVVTAPADGSITNDTTPTVTGTAAPGATVDVFFDGSTTPACTTTADVMGNWSCTPTTPLAMGSHTVAAQATGTGGTSFVSPSNTFTVDTSLPPVAIVTPTSGSVSGTSTVTVTGTTEPNATVNVFLDGATTAFCTVTADASGNWSCPASASLSDGPHAVTAVATDAAGNDSTPATHAFTIDTTAPVVPVITAPGEGDTTSPTPTFAGTAEPGSTVALFVDGGSTPVCTATADASGNFTCVASTALAVGAHSVIATSTDAAGNSSDSATRNFTVEPPVAPGPPVVTAPVDGSRTTDTTPTFSGTAAPGSTVNVYVDGGSTPVCTATADAAGAFSCTPATPLAEGPHTTVATATNMYGTSPQSTPVDFSIDSVPPPAPVITSPAPNATTSLHPTYTGTAEPGATVDVFLDGGTTPVCTAVADVNGQWACTGATALTPGAHDVTARATDAAGNQSPDATPHPFTAAAQLPDAVITSPAANEVVGTATPDFTGTATPNATISVYVDGSSTPACVTVADNLGHFACRGAALTDGDHEVTVTATNQEGTSQPGAPVPFVVDTTAPVAPVVTGPADGATTSTLPTYTGTAEPGSTVTVRVDGFVVCVVTATAAGEWSCMGTTPLAEGPHTVNATSTDAAGNRSPTSATNTFTVTVPVEPEADPVLTAPADGALTGATPTFSGTGAPGGAIDVLVDGEVVCSATVDAAGAWACTPASALAAGVHTAVARQTTARGTKQSNEADFTVTVTPVVTSPGEGEVVRTTDVRFTGTATPLQAVEVFVDGELACTAMSDATGAFSCRAEVAEGTHTVVARSAGKDSEPVAFRVGELDRNGDGIVDGTTLTGGGCVAAPAGWWVVAGAAWLLRRRRGRAS